MKHSFDSQSTESWISQLRTGYADLNTYQHKLGLKDRGKCECGDIETVEHFLLVCPKLENIREQMKQNLFKTIGISYLDLELRVSLFTDKNRQEQTRTVKNRQEAFF